MVGKLARFGVMEKFIIEIHDDIDTVTALDCCRQVILGGQVSGSGVRAQHCYHTSFKNGLEVSVIRNRKSERFIVYATCGYEA